MDNIKNNNSFTCDGDVALICSDCGHKVDIKYTSNKGAALFCDGCGCAIDSERVSSGCGTQNNS